MKTHLLIAALSLWTIQMSFGQDAAPEKVPAPKIEVGAKVTLTGKLERNVIAIGGETTGWRLQYPDGEKKAAIEVDLKAIKNYDKLDGRNVTITGEIISKQYVERGAVKMLVAKKVEPKL